MNLDRWANDRVLAEYLTYRRASGRWRPKTLHVREGQLRVIAAAMAPIRLVEATEDDLLKWYTDLTDRGYAAESIASYVSAIRGLFRWMSARARPRLRPDDPTILLDRPKIPAGEPRPMANHHYDLALACSVSQVDLYVWLGLMGCSGLRCCEVAWMQTHDVEVRPDGTGLLHIIGKGGKRRTVPAGEHLMLTLRPFLMGRGPVFTRRDGRPYTPDGVSSRVNRFLRGIQIHDSAHSLRHRFGTDYHELDVDLYRQAKIMGHASVDTTQRYTAISPVEAAHYVDAMTRRRLGPGHLGFRAVG